MTWGNPPAFVPTKPNAVIPAESFIISRKQAKADGLGLFKDDIARLEKAIEYLRTNDGLE